MSVNQHTNQYLVYVLDTATSRDLSFLRFLIFLTVSNTMEVKQMSFVVFKVKKNYCY